MKNEINLKPNVLLLPKTAWLKERIIDVHRVMVIELENPTPNIKKLREHHHELDWLFDSWDTALDDEKEEME